MMKNQYITVLNCIRSILLLLNAHTSLYDCIFIHDYICIRCIGSLLEFNSSVSVQLKGAPIYLCIIWNVICTANKDI